VNADGWIMYFIGRLKQFSAKRRHGSHPEDCWGFAETRLWGEVPEYIAPGGGDVKALVSPYLHSTCVFVLQCCHIPHSLPPGHLQLHSATQTSGSAAYSCQDSPMPSPIPIKCCRTSGEERREKHNQDERDQSTSSPLLASDANPYSPDMVCNSQLNDSAKGNDSEGEGPDERSKYKVAQCSEPRLTWVHVAPISSPRKACLSHEVTKMEGINETILTVGSRGSPAMQDSSISSTTPSKIPKNQKKPTQCQSQLIAAEQQGETETTGTCQGQNQPALVSLKPLARVCPSTVEP
ncbi:hypothetical protein XENOCAPTIV_007886, partial [Xenoophorus captivus]